MEQYTEGEKYTPEPLIVDDVNNRKKHSVHDHKNGSVFDNRAFNAFAPQWRLHYVIIFAL